jgi:hypothetical protein
MVVYLAEFVIESFSEWLIKLAVYLGRSVPTLSEIVWLYLIG